MFYSFSPPLNEHFPVSLNLVYDLDWHPILAYPSSCDHLFLQITQMCTLMSNLFVKCI